MISSWKPERFSDEERRAAGKAITQARMAVTCLDRSEFGSQNHDVLRMAYSRVDDLLAMIYDDVYGFERSGAEIPQPPEPSAS